MLSDHQKMTFYASYSAIFLKIFIKNNITYIILHYFGWKCADALQLAISFRTILVRTPSGSGRELYTINT